MPKKVNHWSYQDVINFLKKNDFGFFEGLKDSQQAWIKVQGNGEPDRIVEFGFRVGGYSVKTQSGIIRQSGIAEKDWIEWTRS